jgi:hypothetical protein
VRWPPFTLLLLQAALNACELPLLSSYPFFVLPHIFRAQPHPRVNHSVFLGQSTHFSWYDVQAPAATQLCTCESLFNPYEYETETLYNPHEYKTSGVKLTTTNGAGSNAAHVAAAAFPGLQARANTHNQFHLHIPQTQM